MSDSLPKEKRDAAKEESEILALLDWAETLMNEKARTFLGVLTEGPVVEALNAAISRFLEVRYAWNKMFNISIEFTGSADGPIVTIEAKENLDSDQYDVANAVIEQMQASLCLQRIPCMFDIQGSHDV